MEKLIVKENQGTYSSPQLRTTFIALDKSAEGEERFVGTAALEESDLPILQELKPWLASVLVVPEYRGKGCSSRLLDEVEKLAYKLGYETLYLHTNRQSPAFKIYLYRGWTVLQEIELDGHKATVMSLKIKPPKDEIDSLIPII